jgi:sugar O-acyltransferase (sialic acid O-acetyltransferase NeuD family)
MRTSPVPESASHLLIFGASGHGRVVADAALLSFTWAAVSVSDRDPVRLHSDFLPAVGVVAPQAIPEQAQIHVAIGDNRARALEARALGEGRMVTVQHPDATVSALATVSKGCFIAAQAVVAPRSKLGLAVIVNHGAVVDHDCLVGAYTHIAPRACLGGGVHVGQHVLLGAGAIVLPGIEICDHAVIGAGAVVCKPVREAGTYVGVPARRLA